MGILVVGDAVVDRAYRVPRLPRPGETPLAGTRTADVGGKGLNQAVAAKGAGAEVRLMVTPVGRDQAARRLRGALAREGLDPALQVAVDAPQHTVPVIRAGPLLFDCPERPALSARSAAVSANSSVKRQPGHRP